MAAGLEGTAALLKQLEALGNPKDTQRVLRAAVGAGMREVQKEARARVPVGTAAHKTYKGRLVAPGFASRNLRVVTLIDRRTGNAVALLGPRKEAYYATQFIELGTAKIPRRPWLVPSLMARQEQAQAKLTETMRRRIEKIARSR